MAPLAKIVFVIGQTSPFALTLAVMAIMIACPDALGLDNIDGSSGWGAGIEAMQTIGIDL